MRQDPWQRPKDEEDQSPVAQASEITLTTEESQVDAQNLPNVPERSAEDQDDGEEGGEGDEAEEEDAEDEADEEEEEEEEEEEADDGDDMLEKLLMKKHWHQAIAELVTRGQTPHGDAPDADHLV